MERENYDADHGGLSLGPFGGYEFDEDNNNIFLNYPEEKKRASYFRERDVKFGKCMKVYFKIEVVTKQKGCKNRKMI